jgi:hypothetical protein
VPHSCLLMRILGTEGPTRAALTRERQTPRVARATRNPVGGEDAIATAILVQRFFDLREVLVGKD